MRRFAELIAVAGTALILIATSQSRQPCASETINLRAETTCGPVANLGVTSDPNCLVVVTGAEFGGLPPRGSIRGYGADAGVLTGFHLAGVSLDGGNVRNCEATLGDAGTFGILCIPTCGEKMACEERCSGTLRPQ